MIHPEALENKEIQVFNTKGGLFDVTDQLGANVGRWGAWIEPSCGVEKNIFQIAGIQKNYCGEVVYRVTGDWDSHNFGCPVEPAKAILFFSEKEAEAYINARN
jgi:hypothetical protein